MFHDIIHLAGAAVEDEEAVKEVNHTPKSSPRRVALRDSAHKTMSRQAGKMKERASRKNGWDSVIPVGAVVHVDIAKVDRAKVDSRVVAGVVVEVVAGKHESSDVKYRVACHGGVMKACRVRAELSPAPHMTPALIGLPHIEKEWQVMSVVGDRECVRAVSCVGGQGHIHCLCKGKCETGKCTCLKAGVLCNSRCHPKNHHCTNK